MYYMLNDKFLCYSLFVDIDINKVIYIMCVVNNIDIKPNLNFYLMKLDKGKRCFKLFFSLGNYHLMNLDLVIYN